MNNAETYKNIRDILLHAGVYPNYDSNWWYCFSSSSVRKTFIMFETYYNFDSALEKLSALE